MRQTIPARAVIVLLLLFSCLLAGRTAPSEADRLYTTASQYFEKQAYTSAISELTKFITACPKDTRIFQVKFLLGRAYQHQEKYDQALDLYQQVINEAGGPQNSALRAEVHYQLGQFYWTQRQFEKAIKSYTNCLTLSVGNAELSAQAYYWRAECLYQLERFPAAKKDYARVPEIDRNNYLAPWAIYSTGMIELRQAHLDEAIAIMEQVTANSQDTKLVSEVTLMLGVAYSRRAQGQQDAKAKDADLHKAIDLFTSVSGNEHFDQAFRQSATLSLGETYFTLKDYERANSAFQQALGMMGNPASTLSITTQFRRGDVLYDAGRYRDAAVVYAIVAFGPDNGLATRALLSLGDSWYQVAIKEKDQKAYLDAIAAFKRFRTQAGEKAPDVPRAVLLTAFCLEDLAAAGDADAGAKALIAYQEICMKWPMSRVAGQAQDGIGRLTVSMSIQQLRAVVEKLPEGAAWSVDLTLARKEFRDGKFDQALTDAQKVLATHPTGEVMAQAAYIIGACLQQTGHAADALQYYKQAQDAMPTGELAPFILRGLILANMELPKHAADARDAALTLSKLPLGREEMGQALLYLGDAYTANGQLAEAMDAYERITKEFAEVEATLPLAYMGMAGVADAKKDTDEAIARYREVIRKFPDHEMAGQAFYRIGVKQAELKQYNEAIDAFKNVPATHRLADRAAYEIAWAYYDQGKFDEANAQFVVMADQFPGSPLAADALARVGEYWMEKQQYADAMSYFNRAFQIVQPGNLAPAVSYKLGVCAFNAKNYPVAVLAFDKVVTDYPTYDFAMDSLFMKGRSLELQDQATPARETFLLFLTKYPKRDLSLDAALGAGRASLANKQYAQARADLTKATKLYEELKKTPAVLADRAKAVMAEVQYYLAQSYFEEANYAEAFKQYAAVPDSLEPWISRALLQMAKCSGQLGNLQDARDVLQSLITRYPQSDAARQAPMVAKDLGLELKPPAP